jgi:hypothetical protein
MSLQNIRSLLCRTNNYLIRFSHDMKNYQAEVRVDT